MEITPTNNKKRPIWIVIITLLSIMIFWLLQNAATAPKASPWQISDQSSEFSFITTRQIEAPSPRDSGDQQTFLILRNNSLIFAKNRGFLFSYKTRFYRINLLTGKTELQGISTQPVSALTNNEQAIFIAKGSHRIPRYSGKTLEKPGAILVKAFDIDTGDLLWSSAYEGFNFVSYITANEDQVRTQGHNGHGLDPDKTALDPLTGEVLEENTESIFPSSADLPPYHHIASLGNNMFVLGHNPIIAYDLKTDSIAWQTDISGSVSNFFVSNGVIYFLDYDSIFYAVDEQTGATLGYVQFEPVNPSKAEFFGMHGNYAVVADGNNVALYFLETQQLFFFHFARGDE